MALARPGTFQQTSGTAIPHLPAYMISSEKDTLLSLVTAAFKPSKDKPAKDSMDAFVGILEHKGVHSPSDFFGWVDARFEEQDLWDLLQHEATLADNRLHWAKVKECFRCCKALVTGGKANDAAGLSEDPLDQETVKSIDTAWVVAYGSFKI